MYTAFWAFLGISSTVIVTPATDTAVTIRSALFGGTRGGVFTALGVFLGGLPGGGSFGRGPFSK